MRGKQMKYNFEDHHEIPHTLASYVVMCADAHSIHQIPLDDINEFLNEMEEHFYE
tara:strand:- start:491 stop:655 length:165 start_codon:yes stop_codon:yes gene_type:complete